MTIAFGLKQASCNLD